jgi:hypothetical protein
MEFLELKRGKVGWYEICNWRSPKKEQKTKKNPLS